MIMPCKAFQSSLSECGNDSFFNLTLVYLLFQSLQDWCQHVWTSQWREVHSQEDPQQHNLLLHSILWGRGPDMSCQRLSNIHCSLLHLTLLLCRHSLLSIALRFTFAHTCLLPKPIRFCLHFPSSSCFLLLARCPARGGGQVQGPLPGPWHGCPRGPEQRSALPVASMGARLRVGGFEGSGGASVLREGGSGPCLLHRWLHFHPDTHPHRWGTKKTRRPGPEGDRAHLWQLGGWHSGAHGNRWARVIQLRLLLCWLLYVCQIFK